MNEFLTIRAMSCLQTLSKWTSFLTIRTMPCLQTHSKWTSFLTIRAMPCLQTHSKWTSFVRSGKDHRRATARECVLHFTVIDCVINSERCGESNQYTKSVSHQWRQRDVDNHVQCWLPWRRFLQRPRTSSEWTESAIFSTVGGRRQAATFWRLPETSRFLDFHVLSTAQGHLGRRWACCLLVGQTK